MPIPSRFLKINVIWCMDAPLDTCKRNQPLRSWWQPCGPVSTTSKTLISQEWLNASHKVLKTEITRARCLLNPGNHFQMLHGGTIGHLQRKPTSTTPQDLAPAVPTPLSATTRATAIPCPRPPPPKNSTAFPVPRATDTILPPPAPATAALASPTATTRATAVPCPRPPPPTNGTVLSVPRATDTIPPPAAPATAAPGP